MSELLLTDEEVGRILRSYFADVTDAQVEGIAHDLSLANAIACAAQNKIQREGWQCVPKEMDDAMQLAGAEAVRVDTTAINKLFIATRVYRAALAAAPNCHESGK